MRKNSPLLSVSAIQSEVYTTTQHTPSPLVFGRDTQQVLWQLIKQCKQALVNKGNQKDICSRQSHVHCTWVLLKNIWIINQDVYVDPYVMSEVLINGAMHACIGKPFMTCATLYLSRNRADFQYEAVCNKQV